VQPPIIVTASNFQSPEITLVSEPSIGGFLSYLWDSFWEWLLPSPPPAQIDVCTAAQATAATRQVTRSTEDVLRKAAANQLLSSIFPNGVNPRTGKANDVRATVTFSDLTRETYQHTTMTGWVAEDGSLIAGTGNQRCQ
jgi:hypothetical protein